MFDPKLDIEKRPRLWVGKMEWEGPLVEWPSKGRQTVFFAGEERDDDAYLREIFAKFLPIAYRRPATAEELDRIVKWRTLQDQGPRRACRSKATAVREGVKNVLCSPTFLYLGSESAGCDAAPVKSTLHSSARSRLDGWQSWRSHVCRIFAVEQALRTRNCSIVPGQSKISCATPPCCGPTVKRMIADPKAAREFVRNFARTVARRA